MKIIESVLDRVYEHVRRDAPMEACGYLAGKNGVVSRSYKLVNIAKRIDYFSLSSLNQFKVLKKIQKEGLKVIGLYHSHPKGKAVMSKEDKRLALYTDISYVIISLSEDKPKSFRLNGLGIKEEPIEII